MKNGAMKLLERLMMDRDGLGAKQKGGGLNWNAISVLWGTICVWISKPVQPLGANKKTRQIRPVGEKVLFKKKRVWMSWLAQEQSQEHMECHPRELFVEDESVVYSHGPVWVRSRAVLLVIINQCTTLVCTGLLLLLLLDDIGHPSCLLLPSSPSFYLIQRYIHFYDSPPLLHLNKYTHGSIKRRLVCGGKFMSASFWN